MAIEAVAAVAAKEIAVKAVKEAAVQAAREIAQKMATEVTGQGRNELQVAMMESQTIQDGFRVGEMPETKGEAREILKQKESDAVEELRDKLDADETQPEAANGLETETIEIKNPAETETAAVSENQEVAEMQEAPDTVESGKSLEAAEASKDIRTIKTIRDDLAGKTHEETGIIYVEKVVETDKGEKVKGVFPVFDSKFEAHLPDELLKATDKVQFAECNKQLSKAIANDPELKKKFSAEQIEQIKDGVTPEGCTWHHNEEKGKMELVDFKIHYDTRHTGGKSIWGGGSDYR